MQHIEAAAQTLADAEHVAEQAAAKLAEAEAAVDQVRARLTELADQQNTIIQERAADAPGKLMLVEADRTTLVGLLAQRQAGVAAVRVDSEAATRAVAHASFHLARAQDHRHLRLLIEHADRLDQVLLGTIGEIAAITGRLEGRPTVWAPSPELFDKLNGLQLQRRNIRWSPQ